MNRLRWQSFLVALLFDRPSKTNNAMLFPCWPATRCKSNTPADAVSLSLSIPTATTFSAIATASFTPALSAASRRKPRFSRVAIPTTSATASLTHSKSRKSPAPSPEPSGSTWTSRKRSPWSMTSGTLRSATQEKKRSTPQCASTACSSTTTFTHSALLKISSSATQLFAA